MMILTMWGFLFICFFILILDGKRKIDLTKKQTASLLLLLFSHSIGIFYLFHRFHLSIPLLSIALVPLIVYFLIRLNLFLPPPETGVGIRSRIMMGGCILLLIGIFVILLQIPLAFFLYSQYQKFAFPKWVMVSDILVSFCVPFSLMVHGGYRIFFTSKRLRMVKRIVLLLVLWIPVVNLMMILYCCYIVKQEYDHACFKSELELQRADSNLCKTKYPLLMVHGVGFRDYKYLNYWGRIPKNLIKNGSVIYYGHNQAWGTIETCAQEIQKKIYEILEETKCEKVNIIAHSKGGLDSRYLISALHMEDSIASLTTIATPHRGSDLVKVLLKLPDKIYRAITNQIDRHFLLIGDTTPDSYQASRQLSPAYLEKFNQDCPDSPLVYYQSYASCMRGAGSDSLLSIPYLIMKWLSGDNDGLVSIESSKWGNFRGVMVSRKHRGISHGDVIDLKREDYTGFDVTEKYIEIVSDLKNMGF